MTASEPIQRVRIYLREHERQGEQPLYLAVLDQLRREGASNAIATRGLAGFDASERLSSAGPDALTTNPPVVIEWIDRAERVSRLLPLLDRLAPAALITVEAISVYRAALHSGGPFPAELICAQVASSAPMLQPAGQLRAAAPLLAEHGALAVVNEGVLVVGLLSPGDLTRRGGLALPLSLLPALSEAEREQLLASLGERRVAEIMTAQPRCINAEASLAQAAATMVEWGFRQLPLIDRAGRYQGMLTLDDVLAAVPAPVADSAIRPAEQATTAALVMQTAVPHVDATLPLATLVEQLRSSPARYLVVSDSEGNVLGALSDRLLLQRLNPELRALALQRFSTPVTDTPQGLRATPLCARDLAVPSPTIDQSTTLFAAIQAMLSQELHWLPVTAAGKLSGLLGRAGLLRALVQEGIK